MTQAQTTAPEETVMRSSKGQEKRLRIGMVTDWKQAAILCLTIEEVLAIRQTANPMTVANKLRKMRRDLRSEGWEFVPAPPESERHFQKAIPPPGCEGEVICAETVWAAEVARQTRSNWGMRTRPGKAAGN